MVPSSYVYSVKLNRILPGQSQHGCLLFAIFLLRTIHSQSAQPPISTIASSYATGVACAVAAADGHQSVQCWGQDSSLVTVPGVQYGPSFELVAGASFFCGLWSNSSEATSSLTRVVACWSAENVSLEIPLPTEYRNVAFSTLAAGASHVCGIVRVSNSSEPWHTGNVLCWIPELNYTTLSKQAQPPPIYPLGSYATIAVGNNFTCGIPALNQTSLVCWGEIPREISRSAGFEAVDPAGGSTILTSDFRETLHDYTFSAISAGDSHVCVLLAYSYQEGDSIKPTRQPMCWGAVTTSPFPLPNPPDAGFRMLVSGMDFSCGIRYNDSRLQCWSDRKVEGLGFQFPIPAAHEIRAASTGDTFVCVVADTIGDNSVLRAYCLGEGAPRCRICGSDRYPQDGSCGSNNLGLCISCETCADDASSHIFREHESNNETSKKGGDDASPDRKYGKDTSKVRTLACLLGVTFVLVLLQLIYILSRLEIKGHKLVRSVQHFHEQEHLKVTEFTYRQLQMATEGFCDKNLVGKGSYGHVFKGMVRCPVTRLVAVKRLEHKPATSMHNRFVDFDSELKLLARLHHPNLVNLVGFCHERGPEAKFRVSPHGIRCAIKYAIHSYKYAQHHATALPGSEGSLEKQERGIIQDRRLLVFDYVENGTLYDHLHGKGDTLESSTVQHLSQLVSSWSVRLRVAAQTAKGLEYLHCMVPPVIHRDVKSSNILLDMEWNAKLSDFGISRLGPHDQQTHVFTDPKGTPGYWDPEYFRTYHLSLKSDVYGFGVVLLELLTGQKAIDRQQHPDGDANLVSRCRSLIQDGEILDSAILDPRILEGDRRQTESICKLANIAEICVRESQKERPTMRQVASWMEQLVQSLSGLRQSLDFDIESETFDNPLVSNLSCGMGKSQSVVLIDGAAAKLRSGNVLVKTRKNPSENTIPEVPEEGLTTSSPEDSAAGPETLETQRPTRTHATAPTTCNALGICNLALPNPSSPTSSAGTGSPELSPNAAPVCSPESAFSLPSRSPPMIPDATKTVSHSGPIIGAAPKSKALRRPPRPPHPGPPTPLRPTLTITKQSFPAVDVPARIIYSGFDPTES